MAKLGAARQILAFNVAEDAYLPLVFIVDGRPPVRLGDGGFLQPMVRESMDANGDFLPASVALQCMTHISTSYGCHSQLTNVSMHRLKSSSVASTNSGDPIKSSGLGQ